jgi:hypothetical protein
MQVCVFPKEITDKHKGKTKTTKEKKTKEKYLQRVVIKRNTFLDLGYSLDRCLAVPLDSVIENSWDPIS